MTFYIGQKSAGEIFLGGKKIGRLYLGQTLIHMTKVVSKPTFLEYIESDGNSWIDTGVYADTTYTFDTTVAFIKESYNCIPWGTRTSGTFATANSQCYLNSNTLGGGATREIKLYTTSGGLNTNWASGIIPELYKAYELKDMTVVPTMITMKYPIVLFGLNNIGTINTSVGVCRIYKWTAYSNGVVVQDLRPCIDPKGVVCFYDMVTKKYFYNQGTGELKAGEPLAGHEELEYLEFDGTQCIDTGLYPNSNMRVESTFMYEGHTEPDGEFIPSRGMYGAKGSGSYIALYSDGYQKWGGVNSVYMGVSVFKGKKVNAVQDKNGVVVDGVLYEYTSVPEDFVNTTNTFLIGDTNGSSARPFIGKMYGLKLYENNVLLRDFIPAKRLDGVKCMYDRVENKYYELKGA